MSKYNSACLPFFMNIILLNKEELVAKNVQEKAGAGVIGRVAAFAANKMVKEDKIVSNLSEALMDSIGKAVEDMGIHIDIKLRFAQGPLCVIQFQVLELELITVIRSAKGEEFANHFKSLLLASEQLGMGDTVMEKIYEKMHSTINDAMIAKFSELIPAKMKEKGVLVECHMSTSSNEGLVFFDLFERLDKLGV